MLRFAVPRQSGVLAHCATRARFASNEATPSIETVLRTALKESMKAKQKQQVDTIKSVLGDMQTLKSTPNPPSPTKILAKAIERRRSAAQEFASAKRDDLAKQYKEEADLLESLTPKRETMLEAELDDVIRNVMKELGFEDATGKRLGQVMKAAVEAVAGKAGGKEISEAVKRVTSGSTK